MKNIFKLFLISSACFLLIACNEKKLNTTNSDTIKESMTLMKKEMTPSEQRRLDADVHNITRFEMLNLLSSGASKMNAMIQSYSLSMATINGLTAQEIHENGERALVAGNVIAEQLGIGPNGRP